MTLIDQLIGFFHWLLDQPIIFGALITLTGLMFLNVINAIREERREQLRAIRRYENSLRNKR